MQLYELEVSNYKCLNNHGMPLKFSNLNVFIGENDSGKTSLLEAIQILLGEKVVDTSMFFNKKNDIKLRGKFIKAPKKILEQAMTLQYWPMTYYKYFEDISRSIYPIEDNYDFVDGLKNYYFKDYIKKLNKYSFYEELIQFFNNYSNNITITLNKTINTKEVRNKAYFDF